jgi:hypothetical protein
VFCGSVVKKKFKKKKKKTVCVWGFGVFRAKYGRFGSFLGCLLMENEGFVVILRLKLAILEYSEVKMGIFVAVSKQKKKKNLNYFLSLFVVFLS